MRSERFDFHGHDGDALAGRLDLPDGPPLGFALFAHCFSCSKDLHASRRVAAALAGRGWGVLRFDFTGLGGSGGDFANTSFSSNVADLITAAEAMARAGRPVSLLVGHSLGGAAVLAAARRLSQVAAVATIAAPSDVAHVLGQLGSDLETVEREGEAQVTLAGRPFRLRRDFVEDARRQRLAQAVRELRRPLMILHSPTDALVDVDHARRLYEGARQPKSFVSLDGASHLLDDPEDAEFAAGVIAAWAGRYLPPPAADPWPESPPGGGAARALDPAPFRLAVASGAHRMLADEPEAQGGADAGPSPYDFLAIALAACTAMTLRLYAARKGWELGALEVSVTHDKVHADDCGACVDLGLEGKVDRFARVIHVGADIPQEVRDRLVEIAGKCPVHRTLEARAAVETQVATRV
ncbi:bifunctional alpha/beta hydrolase/OsmC family protein [uncultured Albimonas sp.]|uniref:bifunctional alpha/beta hydrolase/OsmC family protein n=1 Tax=uncultured Albimonas sp. TaxID=1331701 RepID=UPI0030EBDD9C